MKYCCWCYNHGGNDGKPCPNCGLMGITKEQRAESENRAQQSEAEAADEASQRWESEQQ